MMAFHTRAASNTANNALATHGTADIAQSGSMATTASSFAQTLAQIGADEDLDQMATLFPDAENDSDVVIGTIVPTQTPAPAPTPVDTVEALRATPPLSGSKPNEPPPGHQAANLSAFVPSHYIQTGLLQQLVHYGGNGRVGVTMALSGRRGESIQVTVERSDQGHLSATLRCADPRINSTLQKMIPQFQRDCIEHGVSLQRTALRQSIPATLPDTKLQKRLFLSQRMRVTSSNPEDGYLGERDDYVA